MSRGRADSSPGSPRVGPSAHRICTRIALALLVGCESSAAPGILLNGKIADTAPTPTVRAYFPAGRDPRLLFPLIELDPDHLSAGQVHEVLATAPAPRIILINGSVPVVTMGAFADYLIAMGYPRERLVDPHDGQLAQSSWTRSEELAGKLAWYYEHEAMMPILIGHSQGGMLVVRTLHELAGAFRDAIEVWNPETDTSEHRTTIVDPYSGKERPVVGLVVGYSTALATGRLGRLLLGQWSMLGRLREIPDTAQDFTGFAIPGDLIAGNLFSDDPYVATGTAKVRNVTLPSSYSHIGLPQTAELAKTPRLRAWIDAYTPGTPLPPEGSDGEDATNLLHAADIWFSVKRQWCLASQQLARAALSRP